jgi:hypothetical protein
VHVLTKIFVVLVSLLAVFLVPLVVVYAYNENSYKSMYLEAEAQTQIARDLQATATARHGAMEGRLQEEIADLRQTNANLMRSRNEALVEIRQLESRLVAAESLKAEIQAELAKLASGVQTGSQLATNLVEELQGARRDALVAERQRVELDEALRDVSSQLEVAVAARRALQEELQRVTEQQAQTMARVSEYVARFGELGEATVATSVVADRSLTTNVVGVRRSADQVLVEIGAGSRDGVRVGWVMTIGRGSQFLGNLRIIEVDVNRATGVVSLENPARGLVDIGDVAQSFAGMD